MKETEVKLKIEDLAEVRRRLEAAGFRPAIERQFEDNWTFDFAEEPLRRAGSLLRLRKFGDHFTLTFKGPSAPSTRHKVREEIETPVTEGEQLREILSRLGLHECFRYQKWRTMYHSAKYPEGHVLVDETPVGPYLELEGEAEWIDRVAEQLGFSSRDFILKTYSVLFFEECARRGLQAHSMMFEDSREKA